MGQIAEDVLNGRCCSNCGTYFTQEHGYPVLCKSCWKYGSKTEHKRMGLQKAAHPVGGDNGSASRG